MATPPRRGSGLACKCLSWEGAATHPRRDAKSLTERVRTNEHRSDRKKIAKKATVNDPPRPNSHHIGAPHPHPTVEYCSSTMLAGSELTGSVCIRLRLRVVGNLTAFEERFQSVDVKNLWKTRINRASAATELDSRETRCAKLSSILRQLAST
jgi:hypothetical protein